MNLFEIAFANSSKLLFKGVQQTTGGILTPITTLVGSFLEFFYMWGTKHNTKRCMRCIYLLHQFLNMREKQSCFHAVLQHFSRILGSCSNVKRSEDRQQKTLICILLSGSHQGNLSPRMSRRKHSTRVSIYWCSIFLPPQSVMDLGSQGRGHRKFASDFSRVKGLGVGRFGVLHRVEFLGSWALSVCRMCDPCTTCLNGSLLAASILGSESCLELLYSDSLYIAAKRYHTWCSSPFWTYFEFLEHCILFSSSLECQPLK